MKNCINNPSLVSAVALNAGITKRKAKRVVNSFQNIVKEALLAGKKVKIVGLATFHVAGVPDRIVGCGIPNETMIVPAHNRLYARFSDNLVNMIRSQRIGKAKQVL